jgi:ribosome biogenesis GTPase
LHAKRSTLNAQRQDGLVVSAHGRHCVVETPAGQRLICHPRGKKLAVVVGDRVQWQPSQDEGVIESVAPRRNLLHRQDEVRAKSFAANLDQVLILIAAEPEFSERQLARALLACEAARIAPLIALNKADLTEPFARAWERLAPYRAMGYPVLGLAAKPRTPEIASDPAIETLDALANRLHGHTTLILGPSGAGKSTLINRLVPGASAQTGNLSRALNSGRHTTTHTAWYWLDAARQSALIDSPGFQEFGLRHLDCTQLAAWMPDLKPHVAHCRFYNCTHLHEPGCGVIAAVNNNAISASRYKIYSDLMQELTAPRKPSASAFTPLLR